VFWCCCEGDTAITLNAEASYEGSSLRTPYDTGSWLHGDWGADPAVRVSTFAVLSSVGMCGVFDAGSVPRRSYAAWTGWGWKINRASVTAATLKLTTEDSFLGGIANRTTTPRISPAVQAGIYAITNQRVLISNFNPLQDGSAPYTPSNPSYTYSGPVNVTLAITGETTIDVTSIVQAAVAQPGWTTGDYVTLFMLPKAIDYLTQPHTPEQGVWRARYDGTTHIFKLNVE
jgi:hypothetical protein